MTGSMRLYILSAIRTSAMRSESPKNKRLTCKPSRIRSRADRYQQLTENKQTGDFIAVWEYVKRKENTSNVPEPNVSKLGLRGSSKMICRTVLSTSHQSIRITTTEICAQNGSSINPLEQ